MGRGASSERERPPRLREERVRHVRVERERPVDRLPEERGLAIAKRVGRAPLAETRPPRARRPPAPGDVPQAEVDQPGETAVLRHPQRPFEMAHALLLDRDQHARAAGLVARDDADLPDAREKIAADQPLPRVGEEGGHDPATRLESGDRGRGAGARRDRARNLEPFQEHGRTGVDAQVHPHFAPDTHDRVDRDRGGVAAQRDRVVPHGGDPGRDSARPRIAAGAALEGACRIGEPGRNAARDHRDDVRRRAHGRRGGRGRRVGYGAADAAGAVHRIERDSRGPGRGPAPAHDRERDGRVVAADEEQPVADPPRQRLELHAIPETREGIRPLLAEERIRNPCYRERELRRRIAERSVPRGWSREGRRRREGRRSREGRCRGDRREDPVEAEKSGAAHQNVPRSSNRPV